MGLKTQLRRAFDLSPVPLLLVAPGGEIADANAALEEMFEYAPGDLNGQPVERLLPPGFKAGHAELRTAFERHPQKRQMGKGRDLSGVTRTGRLLPLELGLAPVDLNGTQYTIVTAVDISERKRAETLANSTLEAAASAMVMVNQSGVIVSVNRAACLIFGYQKREIVGQSIELLVPEASRGAHEVYRQSFFDTGGPREMGRGAPLRGRHKTGNEFQLEAALTPLQVHGERLVLATVIDLTERLAAERAIAEKKAAQAQANRLQDMNDELSRFAYATSHDLKGPFTTLTGMLRFCIEDLEQGRIEQVKENLLKLQSLSQRSAAKVEGSLRIAKAGIGIETFEPVNLVALVRDVWADISMLRPDALQLHIQADESKQLVTNPDALRVIVENLLSNAAKYHDRGKRDQWIRIDVEYGASYSTIVIADNGIGIPEDKCEEVFGAFVRLGEGSGDGLGLALVKRHVEALGGTIACQSTIGEGSTFSLVLPLRQEQQETA